MRKSIRIFALLSLLLLTAAPSVVVDAGPWYGHIDYYSSGYGYLIGTFDRFCDGSTNSWGQTSAWAIEYPYDCDVE